MAKKTTKAKKTKKFAKVSKQLQEQRRQFKRIRDAISKIKRAMKAKGFEVHGITINDIRNQPSAVLSEITPDYLRNRLFINAGDLEVDINEYLENPVFYDDLVQNQEDYENAPYDKPYNDVIAQVNNYIWQHEDNKYISREKNDKLRYTLADMLNEAISTYGFDVTADRLMHTDWKNSIEPPFTDSKEERIFGQDLIYFGMVLKDAPLSAEEAMHISDYSLSNEHISQPHGSDL